MECEPVTGPVTVIEPLTVEDFKKNTKIQRKKGFLLNVISIQLV
jgi:hypothetical protein